MDEGDKAMAADLGKDTAEVKRTTRAIANGTSELTASSDRRTIFASDRTLLAAERTYAAWVRTALAALAGGIGAKALAKDVLPEWVGRLTGTVLILFAGFCLIAAVWRELQGVPRDPGPDIKPVPRGILVPMNVFLLLVAAAALVGIWSS